jgi:tight adherence protein C
MSLELVIAVVATFVCVGVIVGTAASRVVAGGAPERRRLRQFAPAVSSGVVLQAYEVAELPNPTLQKLSRTLPKSPQQMSRLRRHLGVAGYYRMTAAVYYSAAKIVSPVAGGLVGAVLGTWVRSWIPILVFALIGFVLPDLVLARRRRARQKAIRNGLPDALDLLVVCVEAGSSLDQAIVKAADELEIAHPALAEELRMVITEVRAGKPRQEAFQNFARRTQVDDVRTLVAMLLQTDRFGTSVAQALRTHAATSRTKRRQHAEERAGKVSVKLVFPLVLCLFPAVYLVCLGPAAVKIYRAFF